MDVLSSKINRVKINDRKYLNCTVKKKTEEMNKPLANEHVHSVRFPNTNVTPSVYG